MDHKIDHSVLIVDDERNIAKNIERLLETIKVKFTYAANGEDGLVKINEASKPFSIIISDQVMPGMRGHEFLEKVKEISPYSLRFLITGIWDMDAITSALNKGSIHQYISKPWDTKDFLAMIKDGLKEYELVVEADHLLVLAKKNNAKLYARSCDLKQGAEIYKKNLTILDNKINELNIEIAAAAKKDEILTESVSGDRAELLIKNHGWMKPDKIELLYIELVKELFEQFQEMAARNGIEMPDSILKEI
jgi:response regulator RpfG family c-di-GMP phosphodiesterase